jgi:hypothetical protein
METRIADYLKKELFATTPFFIFKALFLLCHMMKNI